MSRMKIMNWKNYRYRFVVLSGNRKLLNATYRLYKSYTLKVIVNLLL